MKKMIPVLMIFGFFNQAFAANNTQLDLTAIVSESCSLVLNGTVDSTALGAAIASEDLAKQFLVPVQVECNIPNSKLKAVGTALESASAQGILINYHFKSDVGENLGWKNSATGTPESIAEFADPVSQTVNVIIENFKEANNKQVPAGEYKGSITLTISAN